jgi:hypothetical protein
MSAESRNGGAGVTSIAEQRFGNHVSAATNINKDQFPLQRIAANEPLPGSKSLNTRLPRQLIHEEQ